MQPYWFRTRAVPMHVCSRGMPVKLVLLSVLSTGM